MPTVKLTSNTLQASFNLKGAELCSVKNKQGLEYIWQADAAIWPRHAPILFPIVGKLLNNAYTFLGNKYEMGQHGFARDFDFTIINQSETSCVFELRSNSETKKTTLSILFYR